MKFMGALGSWGGGWGEGGEFTGAMADFFDLFLGGCGTGRAGCGTGLVGRGTGLVERDTGLVGRGTGLVGRGT